MIKGKFFATVALACAGVLGLSGAAVRAQPVQGDDLVQNGDFTQFIVTMNGFTGAVLYRQPTNWSCTNYPRFNKACGYDSLTGTASILSASAGTTVTARQAWPANPQWWQSVNVPVAGTYTLTVKVTKKVQATNTQENWGQSVVIKNGLTPLITVPHANLPVGVETPLSVPVQFTTAGPKTLYLGLTHRTLYGAYGYRYDFNEVTLTYAGY